MIFSQVALFGGIIYLRKVIIMKILVTGFEAFGDLDTNPTKEIVSLLPKSIKGHTVITSLLPVVFDECFDEVKNLIEKHNPKIVIHLGVAAGRKGITPERLAINMKDARISDNNGNQPLDETIIEGAPLAYHSTLPLRKIEDTLKRKHIPVHISNTAGLYVCNNIMYHTLHYINVNHLDIQSGFIHVPLMKEQENKHEFFQMPLYDILEGIIDSIKTML